MFKPFRNVKRCAATVIACSLATTVVATTVIAASNGQEEGVSGAVVMIDNYCEKVAEGSLQATDPMLLINGDTIKSELTVEEEVATGPATEIESAIRDGEHINLNLNYSRLGIADKVSNYLNVRKEPKKSARIVGKMVKNSGWENISIASPDTGGTKRASTYAKALNCELAIGDKQRERQNEVASLQIIGDVKDKNVILVDDIIDTAGTLCKAAARIKEMGALSVRAMCAHGLFSGDALEKIENSVLDEVLITDTIPMKRPCDKVKVVSVAKLLSEIILSVEDNTSISSHYYV